MTTLKSPAPLRSRSRQFSHQAGMTLTEVAVAASLFALVLTTAISVYAVAARAGDRHKYEMTLVGGARSAMDEALSLVRASGSVYGQQIISSTNYSSSSTQVVLSAPGYNPATAAYFLDSVSDYIILSYDSTNQQIVETLIPGTGSVRPSRQNMVLVRNVTSCSFSYAVREYFTSSQGNNVKFSLGAQPNATPRVYVNGVLTSANFSQNNTTVSLNLTQKSNDIQVVYYVTPTTSNTTMALVGEIEVTLQLTTTDSRRLTVSNTINGAARLRNARK